MKKILSILTFMVMTVTLLAQTTLTFVGRDRTGNDYVRLSSVSVYDLDQLWHQIIEYPDTTLVLYVNGAVGVETMHAPSLQMQNNPNPFDGATDVILCTPYAGDVTMEIADVNGRAVVGANDYSPLPTGTHQFRLTLSAPGTYVLTARQNGRTVSVKLLNAGNGGGDGIEYMGFVETPYYDVSTILTPKSNTRGDGHYPFHNGDRMRYTGYAVVDDVEIESETVEKAQNGSETIPLKFDVARPEVVTSAVTDISATAATLHGEVTADNNASVTERGFCYGTGPNPTYSSSPRVEAGDGLGTFDVTLNGLAAATTYYTRAYAKNVVGVSYGANKSFHTNDTLPEVVTTEPDQVTATSFVSGGNVLAANGATVTARGICWSSEQNPTIADSHTTNGSGLGTFASNVTELSCGTTYYVRAYATNSVGTAYGEEISVTTLPQSIPEVRLAMSNIYNGLNIATQAEVLTENCSAVTERGVCWSTSHNPTLEDSHIVNGEGIGVFNDTLTNLEIATNYYIRAYATNELGTAYSEEAQVVTSDYPIVTTSSVINITATTATSGGSITSDGGATVTARGVCWNTTGAPSVADDHSTDGNGTGGFTSSLTGLTANTTYYVRAYATNNVGTSYGDELTFTTLEAPCGEFTLTDIDSNTYNTVQIGTQCWMKENLRTTKYADGTSIEQGDSTSTTTAYWYYPNNDASNKTTYGLLYNWKAVMRNSSSSNHNPSGVHGICPTGWHVPSDEEWKQMEMAMGMSQSDADNTGYRGTIAAKLSGNIGWTSSTTANAAGNLSAPDRNSSGFSALPAGSYNDSYYYFGSYTYFWSATEFDSSGVWHRSLRYNNAGVDRSHFSMKIGLSVRCLRDDKPFVFTQAITNVTKFSAECGGEVIAENAATVTSRGVCWSTLPHPTVGGNHTIDGSGIGSFSSFLVDLDSATTYYVRAYATNSIGTSYGEEVLFVTLGDACHGVTSFTDIESNTYHTVQIGSQCWMKENLRTKKYADGTSISQGSGSSTTTGYWYYPNNSSSNKTTYGLLYNWKAVMRNSSSSNHNPSGVQGICPTGWHVPSDEEWKQMEMAMGMSQSDADNTGYRGTIAAKLSGNTGWTSSTNANAAGNLSAPDRNSSGFSALPAGGFDASYYGFGDDALFWSATEYNSSRAWQRRLSYGNAGVYRYSYNKNDGYSVRCLRD